MRAATKSLRHQVTSEDESDVGEEEVHNTPSSNNYSGDEAYEVDTKEDKAAGNGAGSGKGNGSTQAPKHKQQRGL